MGIREICHSRYDFPICRTTYVIIHSLWSFCGGAVGWMLSKEVTAAMGSNYDDTQLSKRTYGAVHVENFSSLHLGSSLKRVRRIGNVKSVSKDQINGMLTVILYYQMGQKLLTMDPQKRQKFDILRIVAGM